MQRKVQASLQMLYWFKLAGDITYSSSQLLPQADLFPPPFQDKPFCAIISLELREVYDFH